MNTNKIKSYAPKARKDFIAAVKKQAAKYGITSKGIESAEVKGDLLLIAGKPFPVAIHRSRTALLETIQQHGFEQTMEQVAYSWFNRLCAIRFMELRDYLGHGRRVLSHPDHAGSFQILEDCLDIDLPGLDTAHVRTLKLDGTKDEELYRELLLAQCHALHEAMPFLFEQIDDETELLLPDNLTKTDSLIRDLVAGIPESDWDNIEIIGWLYQFYISEKKDQVIGKVVKSEDIPAATQLFTPNWIVKYMVQNSLGAQWLATYPDSPLKAQMEYYIEPAEQTDEVNAQLQAITPTELNPEELTLIDPASGSGHILVEAYELFKAIYLERGYRLRDVPQLILQKNLFGLDIDERAAQLTGFALMMKGRADDRRLFEKHIKLNVMALVDSAGFDAEGLAKGVELADYGLELRDLTELKRLFEHATTFGSLIQVPDGLTEKLPALRQLSKATNQDLFVSEALKRLGPLVKQAELLAAKYNAVVANPPYMGSKGMNPALKQYAARSYPDAKSDLMTCFMQRGRLLAVSTGLVGMINLPSWLFLSSFESFRDDLLRETSIRSCLHLGRGIFGSDFGSVAFVLGNSVLPNWVGSYRRLFDKQSSVTSPEQIRTRFFDPDDTRFLTKQESFQEVPGGPIAYWLSTQFLEAFSANDSLEQHAASRIGMATGKNDQYVRFWFEVAHSRIGFNISSREDAKSSKRKWFPYAKGGSFRRWYGNIECVVDWSNDGRALQTTKHPSGDRIWAHNFNLEQIFKPTICWTVVTIAETGFRLFPDGYLFDAAAGLCQPNRADDDFFVLGALNSHVTTSALKVINPTVNLHPGYLGRVPLTQLNRPEVTQLVEKCFATSCADWNGFENAWDFQSLPLLTASTESAPSLESSYTAWTTQNCDTIAEMKRLEEENNRLFIDAYGLTGELTPDVPIEQITLTVNPAYRYGGKLTEEQLWERFREDTMQELVSYAIGCMMGRYSLDEPGLIYAHSGNEDFDPSRYATFPADDDGIIPLTDAEWFEDDAANRLIQFISVAWDRSDLEENLDFLADDLSPKRGESSRETIRRYLCDRFFKDHMQTYKKRPIYWLFSSGKEKAFQCLVYLHRYTEGTLARMRIEYVIPLTSKLASHVKKLEHDVESASSTADRKRLEKEIAKLHKQQNELSSFDEKLRHYADQQISLDLDDGVKVNYGKFGDLLAEVKAITGGSGE